MAVAALPVDVLLLVVEHLPLDALLSLASTCKRLHLLVHDVGWSIFLRNTQPLPSPRSRWSPLAQVRYNTLSDRAWARATFIARPLSRPWHAKLHPVIALSFFRLLVAAGRVVYSYAVHASPTDAATPRLVFEGSYAFILPRGVLHRHITSIAFLPHDPQDRTVVLGFEDGCVEQVYLPPHEKPHIRQHTDIERAPHNALHHHGTNVVESLSCSSHTLLSLSKWGSVSLTDLSSSSLSTTSVNLGIRSWTSYLCMAASSSYAAIGTTSATPLSLRYIAPYGFSPTPSIALQSRRNRPSAVYGITCPPPSSPLGPSQQIIVSGWFDGSVRIYDLRASDHSQSPASRTASPSPTLLPVLTLRDPWSPEPIYAVSCGGGSASFVAAGTARHSVVAFWDVRQPSRGWSVHAPGNDSSPVYSIVLERSRLFGATQSRPFVYDFGPGVARDTYPSVSPSGPSAVAGRRGIPEDRLNLESNGIGYRVSKYSHCRTGVF